MGKIFDIVCDNCAKRDACCCENCFEEDKHNVFKSLSHDELFFLIEGKQEIRYNPNETIIKQSTTSTYVVCIKQGWAKINVEGVKGKNLIVGLVGKNDFVTGGGLFNGGTQNFTITALSHLECCLIDASSVTKLFSESKQFAIDILRHHTRQNNMLLHKLVNLTQKYMPGRVADTLLYLKNDILNENPFKVPITRQEMAEMSNMTKESFVRILQQFKESELIKTQGSTIEILDENSLLSISRNG